jgi:hypothetical protein
MRHKENNIMFLNWTFEIKIDEEWVIDGFEPTPDFIKNMIKKQLPTAEDGEIQVKLIHSPKSKKLKNLRLDS